MSPLRRILAMLAAVLPLIGNPDAVPAADLVMAVGGEVTSLDPHYHSYVPNHTVSLHIFEGLTALDAKMSLRPALAESWRQVDGWTWEFALRPDVRFHDGQAFTAADAAASIHRALAISDSPFPVFTGRIAAIEVVDAQTVRLVTEEPDLLLPEQLSRVLILPAALARQSREEMNAGRGMIGTGPYRFVSWVPDERVDLTANADYWGKTPQWQHLTLRLIHEDAARIAALISGEVQVVNRVPPADMARLRDNVGIKVSSATTQRLIYLALDSDRAITPFVRDAAGKPLMNNPLRDQRVRKAISIAINRDDLVEKLLEGQGMAAGQFLPPGYSGVSPTLVPDRYDPEAARRLLIEAGHGKGFHLTLHGPSNRYINDMHVVDAIATMLHRVGIQTEPVTMPSTEFFPRASQREFSAQLVGLAGLSSETSDLMRALVAGYDPARRFGILNRGRYFNPRVDSLLAEALASADATKRTRLLRSAAEIAIADVAIVPLYHERASWACRDGLAYTPRVDEMTLAMEVGSR